MNIDFANILLMAFKGFFVLGSVLYFVFSTVVIKQATSMSKNVSDKFNSVIIAFSFVHAAFAFLLILVTFLVL